MNKMKEILSHSGSAEMMIIYYMLDKGIENLKSITEDDIKTVKGGQCSFYCRFPLKSRFL